LGADLEVDLLHNAVRPYAWGSRTAIAELLGKEVPAPHPEAELWMGAHPSARAALDGLPARLVASIAARLSRDRSSFMPFALTQTRVALMQISGCTVGGYAGSSVWREPGRGNMGVRNIGLAVAGLVILASHAPALAQTPPSASERNAYQGLHSAAARGDVSEIRTQLASGAGPNPRDGARRTPLHVAAFASHYDAVRAPVAGGGDINALENDRYDVITIAAVTFVFSSER